MICAGLFRGHLGGALVQPLLMYCRGLEWETLPRIFLPENADTGKADKLRRMGAVVAAHGSDAIETEAHARQEAARLHGSYISPYNDLQVCPLCCVSDSQQIVWFVTVHASSTLNTLLTPG